MTDEHVNTNMAADPSAPWGTPDIAEQVLWSFAHRDYEFCAARIFELLQANRAEYVHVQLLLICLQRLARDEQVQQFAPPFLAHFESLPWAHGCLRLTLRDATTDEVLALAANDYERWWTWFYTWSRCVTNWRRQEGKVALAECDRLFPVHWTDGSTFLSGATSETASPPSPPEVLILSIERAYLAPVLRQAPSLSAAGVSVLGQKREVRLFVSSTFIDLQAEREHLAKQVFPGLRTLCEERDVRFIDVDLRWGVSNEQAAEGEVLPICLAAVDECRPYFIGILGVRYGWTPGPQRPALIESYPFLSQCADASITDMEFRHGVLNDVDAASRARFYFKATPTVRGVASPDPLAELIDRVRSSGLPVSAFESVEDLGARVRADLTAIIDRDFPSDETPGLLEREHAHHEARALQLADVYIGRWNDLAALQAYVEETIPPLIVGGGGRGVSSLLAVWARHYRSGHPADLVLLHLVGASAESVRWQTIAARIIGELAERAGIPAVIPHEPEALRVALDRAVQGAATLGRVVIVLDGLHLLDPAQRGWSLAWLPTNIPENVRLLISTSHREQMRAPETRGFRIMSIEPLAVDERRAVIEEFLTRWSKSLDDDRVERIAAAQTTASPMFLRLLLEELRIVGSHEALPSRIDACLTAPDLVSLVRLLLSRFEHDYEARRPGLVRDAMTMLWASRRGRTEQEMLDFLGNGERLPQHDWAPLHMACEPWLAAADGKLRLPNWAFRTAVEQMWLNGAEEQLAAHINLARKLSQRPLDASVLVELPWQLEQCGAWQELAAFLARPDVFRAAWSDDTAAFKEYWTRIEAELPLKAADAYAGLMKDARSQDPGTMTKLSQFLTERGSFDAALELQASFGGMPIDGGADRAKLIAEQARTAYLAGHLPQALDLYRQKNSSGAPPATKPTSSDRGATRP